MTENTTQAASVTGKEPSLDELRVIIRRELDYWNAVNSYLSIAAVGACANILAATYGIKAPWHLNKTPGECCPKDA